MIKQITLRGISRTPSDRMSADGGCAESLNVQIEEQEIVPMTAPKDVTRELLGTEASSDTNVIFIHKSGENTHYLVRYYATDRVVSVGYLDEDGVPHAFMNLSRNEKILDIVSQGNIVMMHTDMNMHYILLEGSEYRYMGTKIPVPVVRFKTTLHEPVLTSAVLTGAVKSYVLAGVPVPTAANVQSRLDYSLKRNDSSNASGSTTLSTREVVSETSQAIWDAYSMQKSLIRSDDKFAVPVFARYAVRLYDGTHIYVSSPVLLGNFGQNQSVKLYYKQPAVDASDTFNGFKIEISTPYTVRYSVKMADLDKWKDIISAVEIYLSTDVNNPEVSSLMSKAYIDSVDSQKVNLVFKGQDDIGDFGTLEKEVLKKSLLYKVDSILAEEIGSAYGEEKTLKPVSQDELVVKERVEDDEMSFHRTTPLSNVLQYNGRTIYSGLRNELYPGYPFPDASYSESATQGTVKFKFYIKTSNGEERSVILRNDEGSTAYQNIAAIGSWLYYPDPRCFKAEIERSGYIYTIPMKPHPLLNGSYALADLSTGILYGKSRTAGSIVDGDEDRTFTEPGKVLMSSVQNPFVFPMQNRLTLTDEVLSVATATQALSTGQFGQYPVYIFTKGGIWAASLTDRGTFASTVPLSRDVALDSSFVTPVDNAVVFVTEAGVKMIAGSSVTDISPNMLGEHFSLTGDNDLGGIVLDAVSSSEDFGELADTLADSTSFMDFMKESYCLYDYKGARILFVNGSQAYVYAFRTQTWHKADYSGVEGLEGFGLTRTLNSYPDCIVAARVGNGNYILADMSQFCDSATSGKVPMNGVIITRALDFDNDNVRKMIKDLKLRGHHEKGHVKYILMASNDGLRYKALRSLQGCSYNLFRLVILLGMSLNERLSYIDFDYETRFNDKLR